MFALAPTPTPVPTVTVTQTVVVPTAFPTPMITIAPPLDGSIDPWKDVVFGDFGGAALGAFVAVGVAIYLVRKDRKARLEDQRVNLATQFLEVVESLMLQIVHGDTETLTQAISRFSTWGPRMVGLYANTKNHRPYALWLEHEIEELVPYLGILNGQMAGGGPLNFVDVNTATSTLACIQGSTVKWIMLKPSDWNPDFQARRLWEAELAKGRQQDQTGAEG